MKLKFMSIGTALLTLMFIVGVSLPLTASAHCGVCEKQAACECAEACKCGENCKCEGECTCDKDCVCKDDCDCSKCEKCAEHKRNQKQTE